MYLYLLVRAVDHGNEHVEENDDHCDIIDAVQHVADVLYEFMVVLKHHRDHFRQPEYRPEEGLETLLHSARNERENVMMKKTKQKTVFDNERMLSSLLLLHSISCTSTHKIHFRVVGLIGWH